jgi:hypothetical protein
MKHIRPVPGEGAAENSSAPPDGRRVVIIGPHLEFTTDLPSIIEKYGRDGLEEYARKHENRDRRSLNERLRVLSAEAGVFFVDKFNVLFGRALNCPVYLPGTTELIIWDYGHWTLQGAKYFGTQIKSEYPEVASLIY